MKTIAIAMMCHAINAAYCQSMGDNSQVAWDDAPDWQRNSAIAGVEMHLANPDATPEQSHESWYKQKEAEGWKYGEVKDMEKKEHPCFLPYDQLPAEQKAKDYLFRATVHLVKNLPDPDEYLALSNQLVGLQKQVLESQKTIAQPTKKQVSGITVCYTHKNRDHFKDNLYGTGLVFKRDVPMTLPEDIALKFLAHPEFQRIDANSKNTITPVVTETLEQKQKEERQQEDKIFDEIEAIKGMRTKDSVKDYIKSRYGDDIKEDLKLTELQSIAIEKVHSFGVI